MAFLAPLAGLAGGAGLHKLMGSKIGKHLSSDAKKSLEHIVNSKTVHKGLSKLGNSYFGKHSKTARHLLHKGAKVAGMVAGSKTAHKVLTEGLGIGQQLGMLGKHQSSNILDKYNHAMSLHDKMSKINEKHDPLNQKVDYSSLPIDHGDSAGGDNYEGEPSDYDTSTEFPPDSLTGSGPWLASFTYKPAGVWQHRSNSKAVAWSFVRNQIFKFVKARMDVLSDKDQKHINSYLDKDGIKSSVSNRQLKNVYKDLSPNDDVSFMVRKDN